MAAADFLTCPFTFSGGVLTLDAVLA